MENNSKPLARRLTLDTDTEDYISAKSFAHNFRPYNEFKASKEMLKSVYRRGAREFVARVDSYPSRDAAASARLDAFLHVLTAGAPKNPAYVFDNDLLPVGHILNTNPLTASGEAYVSATTVVILPSEEYKSAEAAILDLTEFSGYGYKAEPAIRASWLRAVRAGEDPFLRASLLARHGSDSLDRDLLPKFGKVISE